jgi:hypothetical protein
MLLLRRLPLIDIGDSESHEIQEHPGRRYCDYLHLPRGDPCLCRFAEQLMDLSNSMLLPVGPDILWGSICVVIVATCAIVVASIVRRRSRV